MWRNYLIVAFRNLLRNKAFSFINIFGLAISMSLSLVIIMLVMDQYKYDRHNSNKDRIFRVNTVPPQYSVTATTTMALQGTLIQDYTGIEKAVRIKRGFGNRSMMDFEKDINIPITGFFTDPEFLDVFELQLELGNPSTALNEPFSVVLTKETADKLFTKSDPLGELIKVGEQGDFKVTGVLKEQPNQKSHIVFDGLASISTVSSLAGAEENTMDSWNHIYDGYVYILLEKGYSSVEAEHNLNEIAHANYTEGPNDNRFRLQSLTEITPGPDLNNPIGPFLPNMFIYFLGGLAGIIMLTSCFNYTNLSIARSLTRVKEIGIRKVNGAKRSQIFTQFLSEALLIALIALFFSWLIVILIKPILLNLELVHMLRWDFSTSLEVYPYIIIFALVVGVMAGFFPAIVLSSFQPLKVLKNLSGGNNLFSRLGLRKTLLVFQFAISLIFILSALLVYKQTELFFTQDRGFIANDKVLVKLNNTNYQQLKTELAGYGNIESISAISHIPGAGIIMGDNFKIGGQDEKYEVDYFHVDEDYLQNMAIKLLAGNNFNDQSIEFNKSKIIINQLAVEKFGFETLPDALGQVIYKANDSIGFEIIGIVPNYIHRHLLMHDAPMALLYDPDEFNQLQVKYSGRDEDVIEAIHTAWAKVNPHLKIDYKFFEDEMNELYHVFFGLLIKVVGLVAFLAIMISCLGLLGMATYTAETKSKEVAIRKTLGATAFGITMQLSMGFIKLVGIAILIGLPVAWLLNNLWLETLAYRVHLSVGTISTALIFILILSVLTVGSQTIRAALTNPSDIFRNE